MSKRQHAREHKIHLRASAAVRLLLASAIFRFSDVGTPGPYVLQVLVADGRSGALLVGAHVEIPGRSLAVRSDTLGQAIFTALEPGIVRVTAKYLGYAPASANVVLGLTDSSSLVFLMESTAHNLDTIRVSSSVHPEYLDDFYQRKKIGIGRFLPSAVLDSSRHEKLADLIARRFPGLRAEWDPAHAGVKLARPGYYSLSGRPEKTGCAAQVYIDDTLANAGDVASLNAGDIAGVEYYSNAPPVQYRRAGSQCGVVLLWRKR